ncbi:extracellular solute-binding protein [Paenibacillus sp. GCM10027626]|uniref:extracellular solute-binding protein n=1 Tax=Paenibacillus sp. GCM10027626 TaxID=3273411 RepID=UPI0036287D84
MLKRKWKSVAVALMLAMLSAGSMACAKAQNDSQANTGSPSPSGTAPQTNVYAENGLPKDQKVTLKVGFFESGMGREWFDYAMDTFKQKFPNVSFEVTYSPKIAEIINTKVAANNDGDMFDMFSGSPANLISLAQMGKLEPQDDLWDRKTYDGSGETLKELATEGQFEGAPRMMNTSYVFPNSATGSGLFFDKKLFEKNGWNQNPKTWDEFVKLLEDIKAKGIIPITYPGIYPSYLEGGLSGPHKLFEIAEANGTLSTVQDNFRHFSSPYYTSPENIERWNKIYELGQKGFFPSGVAALNHTQSQMQVLQGKAALVSTGVWVGNEMKESTPADFVWGFMIVPMTNKPDDTKWMRLSAGGGMHYIWAAKPELNKKWAKEFNVWTWNMDIQQMIAEKGGMLPIRKDYIENKARADKLQSAPKAFLEYIKTNKVRGESGFTLVTLTDPAYAQAVKVINESVTQITEGKQDPQPKLQEAEELLKKAMANQK